MPPRFYGDLTAYTLFYQKLKNYSATDAEIRFAFSLQVRTELSIFVKFIAGVLKGVGFPIGFLLQILTVIFLLRGNSGYSRSARNWFLMVVGADIASTLYRLNELVIDDFPLSNPDSDFSPSSQLRLLMWGLRQQGDVLLQRSVCKTFFIVLFFPIYLSPIALTVSSLIRCYCVKFPLHAKAALTKRLDKILMVLVSFLALAVSLVLGAVQVEGWSNFIRTYNVMGMAVFYGECSATRYDAALVNKAIQLVGFVITLFIAFFISFFNLISSVVIIIVLFQSRRARMQMSSSDGRDNRSEIRATAMLLGMNLVLFICFFVSRMLLVISTRINYHLYPVSYVITERLSAYLFPIPYFTNSLFIAGLSKNFYLFLMPCLAKNRFKAASTSTVSDSQKTL